MWHQHLLALRTTVLPPTASAAVLGGPLCRDSLMGSEQAILAGNCFYPGWTQGSRKNFA